MQTEKKPETLSAPIKAFFIKGIINLLGWLPFSINRKIGAGLGYLIWLSNSRIKRTSITNIKRCLPHWSDDDQAQLVKQSCIHSGMAATEATWIWCRPPESIIPKIIDVKGKELIERALKQNQGVVLTGPHLGCWELITFWCGLHFDNTNAMYRSPKIIELDHFIKQSRGKTGAKLLSGEYRSTRTMLKQLQQTGLLVILSDQQPLDNSGVFSPFYNQPAYTMTLVQKLVQKTQSQLLHFNIIRVKHGFSVVIESCDFDTNTQELVEFAKRLNQKLQQQIDRVPEQFEWGYKRFKKIPEGIDIYAEN